MVHEFRGTNFWDTLYRKLDHQVPGGSREKLIVMHASSLHRRRNLTAG